MNAHARVCTVIIHLLYAVHGVTHAEHARSVAWRVAGILYTHILRMPPPRYERAHDGVKTLRYRANLGRNVVVTVFVSE